ncbi:acyl-CoA dehydrogenase [Aurantivibrio plasticivorans]
MSQNTLLNERDIEFLLYEVLNTQALFKRPRYSEHTREIFAATLETARTIAEKYFANHYAKGDAEEPSFDGTNVHLIPETKEAWTHFADAGFLAAHYDFDEGGMQLPEIILRCAMAYIDAANIASAAYPFLTIGSANLIHTFGSTEQKAQFLPHMQSGRFAGTMALTEPNQGSALADITTYAVPNDDGSYRIFGQKMYISGGDQSITDNIVHMVLAKIKGAPPGAKGISLFICPKYLVDNEGNLGERNDVALAGLLHKMGNRNTTSTVLKFGENGGATGYLVGKPHHGLNYMFQMMNEARIGVGLGASVLGYQGFNYSLAYARERLQGRKPSNKDPLSKQIPLIEHSDVRRLLLAQKAYAEGALAMCLFGSSLFEDSRTAETEQQRSAAALLLDLVTPMVKSWTSTYGMKANEYAIQVLGGAGYTREYPVEQYYRDNRLNPIHEGAEAIHGLDILGRKITMKNGAALNLFIDRVEEDVNQAERLEQCSPLAGPIRKALSLLHDVSTTLTQKLAEDPDLALANATLYLDFFGRIFASWIWLQQAIAASKGLTTSPHDDNFYQGKLKAAQYYIEWELPYTEVQAKTLAEFNDIPHTMRDEWF